MASASGEDEKGDGSTDFHSAAMERAKLYIDNDEPLYVGNFHQEESSGGWHQWCLFLSASPDSLIEPTTVDKVEYQLHPSFRPAVRELSEFPYCVSCRGWGTFAVTVRVHFKAGCLRPVLVGVHLLSFGAPTTVTDLQSRRARHIDHILRHDRMPEKWKVVADGGEAESSDSKGFVKTTSARLLRNIARMQEPLILDGFVGDFRQDWLPHLVSPSEDAVHSSIDTDSYWTFLSDSIPIEIWSEIADFALLKHPLQLANRKQEIQLTHCKGGLVNIVSGKVKAIDIRNCEDLTLLFNNVLTVCQVTSSKNIRLHCKTGECQFYRCDQSSQVSMAFKDTGTKPRFLSCDSSEVEVTALDIQWELRNDDDQEFIVPSHHTQRDLTSLTLAMPHDEMARISAKWRGAEDPFFTLRPFRSR